MTIYEIIQVHGIRTIANTGTPELLCEFGSTTSKREALIIKDANTIDDNPRGNPIIIIRQGDESRADVTAELAEYEDIEGADVATYLVDEMGYTEDEAYKALGD